MPKPYTTSCDCGDTGYRIAHRQGDPVPHWPGWFYASTLFVECACRTGIWSEGQVVAPEDFGERLE